MIRSECDWQALFGWTPPLPASADVPLPQTSQAYLSLLSIVLVHVGAVCFGLLPWVEFDGAMLAAKWLGVTGMLSDAVPWSQSYFLALLWAMRTLSGYGTKWPETDWQHVICILLSVAGVGIFAAGLALVLDTINSMTSASNRYRQKIDSVSDVLKHAKCPLELQVVHSKHTPPLSRSVMPFCDVADRCAQCCMESSRIGSPPPPPPDWTRSA